MRGVLMIIDHIDAEDGEAKVAMHNIPTPSIRQRCMCIPQVVHKGLAQYLASNFALIKSNDSTNF